MKNIIFTIIILCIFGCGVDVTDPQAGYFDDHTDKSGTQNFNNNGSGTMNVNINYNSSSSLVTVSTTEIKNNNQIKSYFNSDLLFGGLNETGNGFHMVMENKTAYYMSIKVNYKVTCILNGTDKFTKTQTISFILDAYESEESHSPIDGVYHWAAYNSLECSGTINSIIPNEYDKSGFQAWSGTYNFKS